MGTFSVGTLLTLTITPSSLRIMLLNRYHCSDTGVILLGSPSRMYPKGKNGGIYDPSIGNLTCHTVKC